MSMFKKATAVQSYLRASIYGPSGGGKTLSSLRLAKGLGGAIAVIDSERGSASKCVGHPAADVDFDVCELDDLRIADYVKAINAAAKANYPNLIIDSATHAWRDLLEEIDEIANQKFGGNKWAAWSKGTPKQTEFINTILRYPGNVIFTMRAKTEWTLAETEKGGKKPQRVGQAPDQGKGIEYEVDLLIGIDTNHVATVEKDRTGKFQDAVINPITEDFGMELAEWLKRGRPMEMATPEQLTNIAELNIKLGYTDIQIANIQTKLNITGFDKLTAERAQFVIGKLESTLASKVANDKEGF